LYREDGYCLFIGTGYRTNTFHHVVETEAGARCLGERRELRPVRLPDGRNVMGRTWAWRDGLCPVTQIAGYSDCMADFHRQTLVGASTFTLYRLRDAFRVIYRMLERGVAGYPPCRSCPVKPKEGDTTVESDWDHKTGRPLPNSEAWTY
jgi:aminoglycoside N3'-acetyltransferase